jgi:hypothetical protein
MEQNRNDKSLFILEEKQCSSNFGLQIGTWKNSVHCGSRNRPDIRQSPILAGYLAQFSGSGSSLAEENFAGFRPENFCFFEGLLL